MTSFLKPESELRRGYKDKKRLAMVASYPCLICESPANVHHFWGQGAGLKASDLLTIPLCRNCHQGTGGLHDNLAAFEKKYGTQKELINEVNERIFQDNNLKGKDLRAYELIKQFCKKD